MSEFIKNIKTYCSYCNKVHEVELRKRKMATKIENSFIEAEAYFYKCNVGDETEFITQDLFDDNFSRALTIYKEKKMG